MKQLKDMDSPGMKKKADRKATPGAEGEFARKVAATADKYGMFGCGDIVLVGLSGGPDSVCLLSVLSEMSEGYGITLHAVYVNHNLRPGEIPGEIEFCKDLCGRLGVGLVIKSIDVLSRVKRLGLNKQEAARELRYGAFEEAAAEVGASRIALAHNADDQVETICMRLIRGAGPGGLSGMPAKRGKFVRPLIETGRADIESFLFGRNISFVVDSSNLRMEYLRNRIRRVLIPAMKELNPSLLATMTNMSSILQEEERYFGLIVTKALMKMISRKTQSRIELFLAPMLGMDTAILRRVLRRAMEESDGLRGLGFAHLQDVINLVRNGVSGGRLYLPKGIRVIKDYAVLVVTSEKAGRIDEYELPPTSEIAIRGTGTVIGARIEDAGGAEGDGKTNVLLDASDMKFPLRVRPRAAGDFFFPMGFGRRKKLQDFFVDAKVPRDERDMVPIVVSGDDIVWVAGYRADERFRVQSGTEKFLRLNIRKGNC